MLRGTYKMAYDMLGFPHFEQRRCLAQTQLLWRTLSTAKNTCQMSSAGAREGFEVPPVGSE